METVSLVYTRSAVAHKIYPTLNKCMQPEQNMVNARPINDRVTRLFCPALRRTTKAAGFVLLMAG